MSIKIEQPQWLLVRWLRETPPAAQGPEVHATDGTIKVSGVYVEEKLDSIDAVVYLGLTGRYSDPSFQTVAKGEVVCPNNSTHHSEQAGVYNRACTRLIQQ
jgi:hypothetical protein